MVGKEHQVQIGRKCISINDEDWERGWVSEKVLSSYQDKSTGKIKVFDSCHHHHCYDDPHHFSFVSCQVDVCPKWLVLKSFNYFLSLHLARINLITIVITSSPPLIVRDDLMMRYIVDIFVVNIGFGQTLYCFSCAQSKTSKCSTTSSLSQFWYCHH